VVSVNVLTRAPSDTLTAPCADRVKRRRRNRTIVLRPTDLDISIKGIKLTGNVRLFQRTNGRWYVRFTLNGKRRMLSTGETDKTHALLKLGEIVKAAERTDTLGSHGSQVKRISTFRELAKEYIAYAEANKAVSTAQGDKHRLGKLLAAFGSNRLTDITQHRVELYIQERRKVVKSSTVNRDTALLKHMLNKAVDWGYLQFNPLKRVKLLKEPPGRIRYLSDSERERFLDTCKHSDSDMLYPVVLTALLTGMRRGELRSLIWDNIDLERGEITLKRTKNNEVRVIPISNDLLPVLLELKDKRPHARYVFSKPDGTAYGDWKRSFDTACKQAGIKDFRFHDLRHTFGSYLGMKGCNAYTIMRLMGHKTIAMSARYTHISEKQLRAAVDQIGAKVVQSESAPIGQLSK